MANLLGQDIGTNYKGIITIGSTINQNVSASLQSLTDGDGNALPIQVSTTNTQLGYGVGIGGAPTNDGLKVYGQSGKTAMSLIGIGATMYIDLNGTGTNFFDSVETRYRNAAGTNIAMNVWGDLGRVAIGGLATNYTPTAALQVRGDGINTIGRFEHSNGTAALLVTHTPNGVGLQTSGSWTAYNNSTTQLVGIQGGVFYVVSTSTKFEINLGNSQVTLYGRLLGSASTTTRATLNIPSGVAPTTPSNGDIWFDGTNIFMRIGGVTKTFTLV